MPKLRIVYMGTPDFAVPCLEKLIDEQYEIAAVVTQPDRPKGRGQKLTASPVKETALKHGLPVLQPEKIKDGGFIDQLAALKPDVIVVVAFGQFLPKALLDMPPLGCINVHASLLPFYRGAAPIHWSIINGENATGVTTMFMDVGMDTGDMILKVETPIGPDETTGELHDRLQLLGADCLAETLKLLAAGRAPRIPQDNGIATYAPLLTRELELIDWQQPAQAVHNLIRGLSPWPGAYTLHQEKILKVRGSRMEQAGKAGTPGQVLAIGDDGMLVATMSGSVLVTEVQPESKRRMSAAEYARGYGVKAGEFLG